MNPILFLLIYCVLLIPISLFGGWLPNRIAITHTRMQLTLSFVGGLMLGIAVLNLIPHAVLDARSLQTAMGWMLAGLLFMFFLIRLFHFHQHVSANAGHEDQHAECDHQHAHVHHHDHGAVHELSWAGIATGMSVHSVLDGMALGTAVMADASHGRTLLGIGVFLAVALHKPLDALSITMLMKVSGWPDSARWLVNVGFSLICPIGAAMVVLGLQQLDEQQTHWIGNLMGFSTGVFLCISLSDLLPEVQFHRHDRIKLSVALLMGILVAMVISLFDPEEGHSHHNHAAHSKEAISEVGGP